MNSSRCSPSPPPLPPLPLLLLVALVVVAVLTHSLKTACCCWLCTFFFINDWLRYRKREGGGVCVCVRARGGDTYNEASSHRFEEVPQFQSQFQSSIRAHCLRLFRVCFGFAFYYFLLFFFFSFLFSYIGHVSHCVNFIFACRHKRISLNTHTNTHTDRQIEAQRDRQAKAEEQRPRR